MDRGQAGSPHSRATAPRLELSGFPEIAKPRALPAPEHVVVNVELQAPILVEDQHAAPGDRRRRLVVIFEEGRVLRTLESVERVASGQRPGSASPRQPLLLTEGADVRLGDRDLQ